MDMFNFDFDEVVELGSRSRGTTGKNANGVRLRRLKTSTACKRSCRPSTSPMKDRTTWSSDTPTSPMFHSSEWSHKNSAPD